MSVERKYIEISVLDHGFVRLDDFMADDLSVVNSARVSFGKRSQLVISDSEPLPGEPELVLAPNDVGLLKYLMRSRHGTPFEHNAFRFHVKAPIFVFREWQRHRIGSFNEMSARYMELPGEWYMPQRENVRVRVGKPGHYSYEQASENQAIYFLDALEMCCRDSYEYYKAMLVNGIAPEQARFLLHVNHYSEMYWTVNARSLMNFLNLRNAETAQWEIRQYAQAIENLWRVVMPVTHQAFVDSGRIAP